MYIILVNDDKKEEEKQIGVKDRSDGGWVCRWLRKRF